MYVIQDSVHYWLIYFVSRETDIWVEREKKFVVVEKYVFNSKKQAELNVQTVLLK